jgi:hypothetical protein
MLGHLRAVSVGRARTALGSFALTLMLLLGVTVVPAGAELPELGHCVRSSTKSNPYKDKNCVKPSKGGDSGYYEWEPMPAAPNAVSGIEYASLAFFNAEKIGLGCRLDGEIRGGPPGLEAEYTGPQTILMTLNMTMCSSGGDKPNGAGIGECESSGHEPGQVRSNLLEGTLGYLDRAGKKPSLGWEFKSALGGPMFEVTCGEAAVTVTGSMVALVSPADAGNALTTVLFGSAGKKVVPDALEGMEPAALSLNIEGEAPETVHAFSSHFELESQAVEYKALP